MAEPLHSATQETKDNLGDQGLTAQILLRKQDRLETDEGPSKYLDTDIGDVFILGHSENGVLGVANGHGGTQITLGRGKIGATTIDAVTNPANRFRLFIRSIETDAYSFDTPTQLGLIDSGNTTATVNTTLFKLTFTSAQIVTTDIIAYTNGTTITNARVVLPDNDFTFISAPGSTFPMTFPLTFSGSGDLIELSADGGSNWETFTPDTNSTFTNTGEKLLMRITSDAGTYIKVRDADGGDTPIEVFYNENL